MQKDVRCDGKVNSSVSQSPRVRVLTLLSSSPSSLTDLILSRSQIVTGLLNAMKKILAKVDWIRLKNRYAREFLAEFFGTFILMVSVILL